MRRYRPPLPFVVGAVWFALLGFFEGPIGDVRPESPELRAGLRLVVTSGSDSGPGSLREAILTADRSSRRVRIDVRVPRVRLASALPPLVGREGVTISGDQAMVVIEGEGVGSGSLLEIAAPHSVLQGLRLQGAVDRGVLIGAADALLRGVELVDCAVGVLIGEGGEAARVEGSRFSRNGTGIAVEQRASGVVLVDNSFSGHDRAAVWAVAPAPLLIGSARPLLLDGNRFEDDRISLVLIHVGGRVEKNQFRRATEVGVLVSGRAIVRENRIEAARSVGILADAPAGALFETNEVSGVSGIGMLVRDGRDTELRDNRVYGNGYGIAVVFGEQGSSNLLVDNVVMSQTEDGVLVLAGAPVLRRNRILRNQGAGLRLLDLAPLEGPRRRANPVLDQNVLEGNRTDEPVRGEYREGRELR